MLVMRFSVALLLLGCGGPTDKEVGWQPLQGIEHKTPNYLISFWWIAPAGGVNTPEEAGVEIERVYVDWLREYAAKWGDREEWRLLLATLYVDIQLFPDSGIRGNDPSLDVHTLGIWWYDHNQIDVAQAAPYHWDSALGIYTQGLEVLKHEWTHCVRGWYHQ